MTRKRWGRAGAAIAALWIACAVLAAGAGPEAAAAISMLPQQAAEQSREQAPRSAEATILAQLEAFNAADIESMVANVAPEFAGFAVESDRVDLQLAGRGEFRRSIEDYFASVPEPRAEIDGIVVSGDFVSVREVAYWLTGDGEVAQASLAIYEVREGLIHRVWYYPVEPY